MATTEADIPEPVSLTQKVGENVCLTRGQSDGLVDETFPDELKKLQGLTNLPPETAEHSAEKENMQVAIGPETMNAVTEGNTETAEGERFFESPSAVEVASIETCKVSKHCQDEEVPNEGDKEMSDNEKQMNNKKIEAANETGNGGNEVMEESEEKTEKNDKSHEIVNITESSLQMTEIEESNLIGEKILMEERSTDQDSKVITDQDVSGEDEITGKETGDMHINEKDGTQTDRNTDLEFNKEVLGILEAKLDQNEEASICIRDPTVISLNKDVESIIEKECGEKSSKEEENKAEMSTNLVGDQKSPEAIEPSEKVGNGKEESEISMHDGNVDSFTSTIAVHPDIQSDEEETLKITEGVEEILYKASITLATDASSIHEAGPQAEEIVKEASSISCKEEFQDKIEPIENMKYMTQVEDETNQKNSLDTFATKIEETCLQKVDNPELFEVTHEILTDDIVKESPKELQEQIDVIEKTAEDDSISSEKNNNFENAKQKGDGSFTEHEGTLSANEGVATTDESSGEKRYEEGSSVIMAKDNTDHTEIINALEHSQSGTSDREERPENLEQNESGKEKLQRPLSVVDDDFIETASTEHAETISCVKEEAPIKIHEERFEEKNTAAMEHSQSGTSDCEERTENLQQNEPEKEKLEGSLSVLAMDSSIVASTESDETATCAHGEKSFKSQEESFEEIMKEDLAIHIELPEDKNEPQIELNEQIEGVEVEVPNNNANDLHDIDPLIEVATQIEGKSLNSISNFEPEGQGQEAYEASTEEDKHTEDAPEEYQRGNCTILEHPSTEGGVTTELIPKTSETSVIKDSRDNTDKEMKNNEEACGTLTDKLLSKSNDAGKSTIDPETSLEADSAVFIRDEKAEQKLQVQSPLEAAPASRGEDESYKAEDNDKRNNVAYEEVYDGTKITGSELSINEQVITGTLTHISPESIEQETVEIALANENKVEKSEEENSIEQVVDESNTRALILESVEQVPFKNLEDETEKAEEPTGEIYEKAKKEGAAEIIKHERSTTIENPQEILDTCQVKEGESLQREGLTVPESSLEEKPEKKEPGEKPEQPLYLMSEKNEPFSSDADKIPCQMEEGVPQNLEEAPQKEETEKETQENNDTKDNKIETEEDHQVVVETSDASKSTESIVLEPKTEMGNMVAEDSNELLENCKDSGNDEEAEKQDIMQEYVATNILQEPFGEKIVQSSGEDKKEEEACAQFEATSVETQKEENILDPSKEIVVEKVDQSFKEDHTVTYISSESVEQETIEIYPVDTSKGETSGGENNLKQIVEESNSRDLIPESVDQVPVKNLEDEEKKAKDTTGETSEKSKMEETAESIVNETCKTTESTRENFDTFQVKQGESLQSEEKNVTVTESSPEEKSQKNEPPEQLEKPLSLISDENEAFPYRMEEGTPQNLEEAAQKEENEKETELKSEIENNKITMEEDHQLVAEISDKSKVRESRILETMTEMNNMVVEDDIKKEESQKLCEDCTDAGEIEETKQHETTEECVTTPELIEQNMVQSSEDNKREEETQKIEACAQLEATSVGEDAGKQTQNEENIVDQSRELEIDEAEQRKEDHTVANISLESTEQETAEIYPVDAKEAEKSEGESKIKQIIEDSKIRDLIPECVEQASVKNLEDEEKKAEECTGEIFEESKTEETGEGIANETWKTTKSPQEILDTFQVKKGESFQSEEKNVTATESSSEEKLQKNEAEEELEKPLYLMSDKNEAFGSDADKMHCLMEKGASQNIEEAPQQEENDKETEDNNDTEDKKIATEKDLQVVVDISDTSKTTESIVLESKSEMDKMVDEVDTRKGESKELCEDTDFGKVEEIGKHDTVEECVTIQEPIGEKIVQSSEENKKLEEAPLIEFEATSVETQEEENVVDHSSEIEVDEIEESSKGDYTVTYISSESTERETIEIYPVDASKEETSGGKNNVEQIVEVSNTRDFIPELVDQVPVKNLEDEETKAKDSTGEIFEKSKMEETAESIFNETCKTTESPREILDTFQGKQGESLQTEEENIIVTESSPEEKQQKNDEPEQLEKVFSLMSDKNEAFIPDSDKIPCRMDEGIPQNLEEASQKEESEKETKQSSEINDNKIVMEEDHQAVVEISDTRKSTESTILETMTEMNNVVVEDDIMKEESKELCEDCKDAGEDEETKQLDTTEECVTTPELIEENIAQSSEDDKREEETPKIKACEQLETTSACEDVAKQSLMEEIIIDQSKEEKVEETEQSFTIDHTVANISLESIEQEAVDISSGNKINVEASVEQVSVKNLEDKEKKVKDSTGEIFEKSKVEEIAESIINETCRTIESPREILDTFQAKQGESLQSEAENATVSESSLEEKQQKNDEPEQLEKPLSLLSDENETIISADKIPCRMEEGTPQNLEETPQKEENEKETEHSSEINDNRIVMEEDHRVVAEMSDKRKSTEIIILETVTKMNNVVVEDDIQKEESKELCEDSREVEVTEQHDTTEECVTTPELIRENMVQISEDDKKEEETQKIEACAQLEATSAGEDAEKQTQNKENIVDQSRDLEVSETEQSSKEDHTVPDISLESIEKETAEIYPGNANETEKSEGENKIKQIVEESDIRDLIPESIEQVSVKNLEDEEKKAEESTGEDFEKSKMEETSESIADETWKTTESPKEILDSFQEKEGETLQTEEKNGTATKSSSEEKPQKNKAEEELEKPLSLMSNKNEAFDSDAGKMHCRMEEGAPQNLEEAPQKEENSKEIEDNKIAIKEDLQVVAEVSDTSKTTKSIVLEPKTEMDKMVDEVDTRKEESKELSEDKDVGKVEEIEKHDRVQECVVIQEPIGDKLVQSSEENKIVEEAHRLQFEATNAETQKEENVVNHSREVEVDKIEESSKEDHTVAYISSESTEQETIEIYSVDANKEETSAGENNVEQIVEASNTRDFIPELVDQVPVKNLEDEETKAKDSTGEIFEKSEMEETAESIVNETCKTTENPREILDTSQETQGESLQTEEETVNVTESSPEEKQQKNDEPEQLEKPLSLTSNKNEAFILDSDKIPGRMEEGTPQNLEETPHKEENEKETEHRSEINDSKIVIEEDHQVVAEMSDTRKSADGTVLETMTEINNVVVKDDIKKEESKESCEDWKDAGDVEETEQQDTTKECVTTPELIEENIVESSEDDRKEEETPKIKACAQLDTTTACKDVEKQPLIEENMVEEEVEETEQSFKVDHTVANSSLESVEQEAVEISSENKTKAEESVEQVSVKNLEDEEKQAKESMEEILESSNIEEAAESTANETSKTMESPREILDTFQVKHGEILQSEEMNINATASSQNLEEPPQKEENEKEIEENNGTKQNKITMEEELQAVAETSDASKSTESTVLEPETEMDNIMIEDDIKKKDPKELYEDSKDAGKDAEIEKHDIMEECVNTNILVETTEEKLLRSPGDYKKEEETSKIELEATSVDKDAEKQTLKEESMVDQSRDLEVEKIEQSSNKGHTVTYISSESIEQETVEISPGNQNNAEEISEGQNKTEKIAEESNTRGIVLESVEQVPVKNLEDEEKKAEESTGETFENSKIKEAAESIAHETSKNMESRKEILNIFQVKQEDSLQTEQENLTATESSTEEKRNAEISPVIVAEGKRNDSEEYLPHFPQKNEVGEKLEQPMSLISDKHEVFSSDADKIPCLMEERTRQNLEEAPQKEENEKETEASSDTKGNKMAMVEDPQVVAETSDASKSTESIFLELKAEMDNTVTEDDIKKEDSKELYEDHTDARKDEETEKHDITGEGGTTDILPEPIGEKILQSSQQDEKKEEKPRIEACAQPEIAGVDGHAEKQTLNEETIVHWSRELEAQRIEQSSEEEDMAAKISKQEGCEITQSVDEDEYAGKQNKEGGAAANKFEAFETADSITNSDKQDTEKDTKQGLLSSSVEEESSQEVETEGMKLKEEVDKLNSSFMEKIEVTSSLEETDSVTLKDSAESNINSNPLDLRKASDEAASEEINERLVETSTLVSEVSNKHNKEEITAKQETTIDDSDSVSGMVVPEEVCLQEAETKDKKQVENLAPAFEENVILGTEAKETISDNVDVNVKPEDIPNLGEKRDEEIPTQKKDYKMENEVPHESIENQTEVTANEMPLEEISEEVESSTETFKEHELINSEASEQIGEPTEKSQAPYENVETPFVAQEIDLMQKEDETTNPLNVPELGPLDTEKETANDEVQKQKVGDLYERSELDKEKSLYISEDVETSEREETRELPKSDKKQIEEDCSDNQNQEDVKEIRKKDEPKLEAEVQKAQNANETIKAVILIGKAHEGVEQSEDTEDIKEQLVVEERGINELNALSTVRETTDEVKESSLLYSEHTMAADSKEKTETENSEVEEDSIMGQEAPFARQSDEQKVQDRSIEPPEKIEEITETSSGEAEISDQLVKAFHIDQGEPCLETTEIKYCQQVKEVDREMIEETSGDLASNLQIKASDQAESMTITVENTARGEPKEIKSACEADYESKGQDAEETDFGKCLTEEKLDQVPTRDHEHAQRNNAAMESSYTNEVEETKIAPRAVDETQGPDAEGTAETGRSPNVVKIDQILSGDSEHAREDSFVLENPNADEDNEVKIFCDAIHEPIGQGTEESAGKSPGVEKLDQVPVTNSEDAEKESLAEENKDSDEVVETKISSNVVYHSKEQGTEDSDETGKGPTAEKADADKSEEACKETSSYRAQGIEPVVEDEMTTEQTPLAEKLEEQLQTLTSALPFKNGTTTTVDNTQEEKTEKMDESPEDSSPTKPTEEISRQENVLRELEVSTLGLTTNKDAMGSPTDVHKEEGQTSDGTIQVDHPENESNIKCVDSSSESNKIIDLTRPTEKAGNLEFETSEKALESELVILRHEVLPESEDNEIKDKHAAVINDTRAEENQSKKSGEANEITQKEVLKEEISEEKEVAETYKPNSLCEEKTNKSLQEDEINHQECTGEKTDRTFEATVSRIQDEKLAMETEKAIATETIEKQIPSEDRSIEDQDQVSVENKIIKESFQIESEGKDAADLTIKFDSRNQTEENNFGSGKTEATTTTDEESGIEISQKESIEEFEKGSELVQEIQKSDKTSCETSEKQIPREANIIDCPATMVSTGNESVPPVLQEGITETLQKVEAEDFTPGNSMGVLSEAEEVAHGGEKGTDSTGKETNVESTLVDSDKDSLSDLLQRPTKETMQVGKDVTKVREPTASTEELQTEEAEIIRDKEAKTYEEKDEEEGDEHRKTDLSSDAPIMVEASRDVDVKLAHKKSHNILSGVGSKVKHSISKVKKAITGKSSHHSKQASPK